MKVLLKVLYLIAIGGCFSPSISQGILWETSSFSINNNPYLASIKHLSNGELLGLGASGSASSILELLKYDTSGVFLGRNTIFQDIYPNGAFAYSLVDVPNELDMYYIHGYGFDLSNLRKDFVSKIDTAGNRIWLYETLYIATYISAKTCLALPDKSTISSGYALQPNSGWDMVIRRLDSTGILMWEKILVLPGNQNPLDIEDLLDGSILISGSTTSQNTLLRIDLKGNYLDTLNFSPINGRPVFHKLQYLYDKSYGLGIVSRQGSSTNFGYYYVLDSSLQLVRTESMEQGVYFSPFALNDSTLLFNQFASNDDFKVTNKDWISNFENWSLPYGNLNSDFKLTYDILLANGDAFLGGYDDSGPTRDYYLAKIAKVGEEWIPDPCELSPPKAGFSWSLNGGLLTCTDTSFSGLIYHDTIYHATWTSNLPFDTVINGQYTALWDSASQPNAQVTLVVENFYRCRDTVTLNLGTTGLEESLELDFKVYPNPASQSFSISIPKHTSKPVEGHGILYGIDGRKWMDIEVNQDKARVNITELPRGSYFLRMEVGDAVGVRKLIKY